MVWSNHNIYSCWERTVTFITCWKLGVFPQIVSSQQTEATQISFYPSSSPATCIQTLRIHEKTTQMVSLIRSFNKTRGLLFVKLHSRLCFHCLKCLHVVIQSYVHLLRWFKIFPLTSCLFFISFLVKDWTLIHLYLSVTVCWTGP